MPHIHEDQDSVECENAEEFRRNKELVTRREESNQKIRMQVGAHAGKKKTTKHLACVWGMPLCNWAIAMSWASCRVGSVRLCMLHMYRLAQLFWGVTFQRTGGAHGTLFTICEVDCMFHMGGTEEKRVVRLMSESNSRPWGVTNSGDEDWQWSKDVKR